MLNTFIRDTIELMVNMNGVELELEVVELRRISGNIIEVNLIVKEPVKPVSPEERLFIEGGNYLPEPFIKVVRKMFEKMSEISSPGIVLRLSLNQYEKLGKPVIGDKLKIRIERVFEKSTSN